MNKKLMIKCNCCGQEREKEHELESSMITIEIPWGYFSNKDGEIHKFTLCESCYDRWIQSFQIPVEIKERTEML